MPLLKSFVITLAIFVGVALFAAILYWAIQLIGVALTMGGYIGFLAFIGIWMLLYAGMRRL
jgi:hypothetical protein